MSNHGKTLGWVSLGVVLVACVTATTFASPLLPVVISLLLSLGVWGYFQPLQVACLLGFLTAAFPKAGIKVGTFPFPVFLFGLIIAVLLLSRIASRRDTPPHLWLALYGFLGWIAIRALVFVPAGVSSVAAFVAWSALPVVVLSLSTRLIGVPAAFRKSMEAGFIVAVGYGCLQLAFGVEQVAVAGLTYAFGDDLRTKNNVIFSDDGDISKIPSTYQNGNIFGVIAAVFLILALIRLTRSSWGRLDIAILPASVIAIALSGSRTAILGAILAGGIVIVSSGTIGTKLRILLGVGAVGALAIASQPGLLARYSLSALLESGGAGRSDLWAETFSRLRITDLLFGTPQYQLVEGWLGLFLQLGLIGISLLVTVVIFLVERRPLFGFAVLILAVAAFFDSTYFVFPTWFIPAAIAASSVVATRESTTTETHNSHPHSAAVKAL